jgi:hypothetical protein
MASLHSTHILSEDDLSYVLMMPEVRDAKERIDAQASGIVYFNINLTSSLKAAIQTNLGLDLSSHDSIPMRWIKGDTAPHVDVGAHTFAHTYLVYLTESAGHLIIGDSSYPISANEGFVFDEGLRHETIGTGASARLLMGPMNEMAEPVGSPVFYYDNYADAAALNGNFIANGGSYVLGSSIFSGSIGAYTSWRIAAWSGIGSPPSGVYTNGFDLSTLFAGGTYYVYQSLPCFLEGSKILALVDRKETYVPVESLRKGDLIKTSRDGYKAVELIGKGIIHNPGGIERSENRLYKCSVSKYPELKEDLMITGDHSILVNTLTDTQRAATIKTLGKIFVTDKKYRLTAQNDERSEPWGDKKMYTVWHFALENSDERMNYGVYANGGLLVETCSIRFLKTKSNLTLVDNVLS